jgi:hypothetical protein
MGQTVALPIYSARRPSWFSCNLGPVVRSRHDSDAEPQRTQRRRATPPGKAGAAPTTTAPTGAAPATTAPTGSAPAASTGSAPAASTGSAPAASAPAASTGSAPAVTAPTGTAPAVPAPTGTAPVGQLRVLYHTRSCRWRRSGVGGTRQSDRRKANRASDYTSADDFLEDHGNSLLAPFHPRHPGRVVGLQQESDMALAESLCRSSQLVFAAADCLTTGRFHRKSVTSSPRVVKLAAMLELYRRAEDV